MNIITDTSLANAVKVLFRLGESKNIDIEHVCLNKTAGKTSNAIVITGLNEVEEEIEYNDPQDNYYVFDTWVDIDSVTFQNITNTLASPKTVTATNPLKFNLYVNKNDVQNPNNICRYRLDVTTNNNDGLSLLMSKDKVDEKTTITAYAMENPSLPYVDGYSYSDLELIRCIEWKGNSSADSSNASGIWIIILGNLTRAVIAIDSGYILMGKPVTKALQEVKINVADNKVNDQDGLFLSDSLVEVANTVGDLEDSIEAIDEQIAGIPDEIQDAISSTTDILAQQFVSR